MEKVGEEQGEFQKIEYLQNKYSFCEIKSIFDIF